MLSSMTPAIITKGGQLLLVTGSPGGRTIPNTVIDVVLGVTAFHQSVRAAVDAPRVHHQWLPDELRYEEGAVNAEAARILVAKGHRLRAEPAASQGDAHSIWYDAKTGTAYGANDHRSPDSGIGVPRAVRGRPRD